MRHTTLGRTGMKVSRVAFGTWQLGGDWGGFAEEEATAAIRRAHEQGVTFFDTAQAYGFGASERLLGDALRTELGRNRDELVIATKGGLRRTDTGIARDARAETLRAAVDASLTALGVDYIDLYQMHWPDPNVPVAETAGALGEMVDSGKIRHVGVSNYSTAQMSAFAETLPVETLQPPYHLFRREAEDALLPYARRNDIGVLVYGPLAHGLLTGTLDENTVFPADDWRSRSSVFRGEIYRRNLAVVRELREFATARGMSVGQLALAWTLAHPAVHVAIVGTRNPRHVDESLAAADLSLSTDDLAGIDRITAAATPVPGPSPEGM